MILDTFTCEDCGHTYRDEVMTEHRCEVGLGESFCEHCLPDHAADCDSCADRISRAAGYDYAESAWKERRL